MVARRTIKEEEINCRIKLQGTFTIKRTNSATYKVANDTTNLSTTILFSPQKDKGHFSQNNTQIYHF